MRFSTKLLVLGGLTAAAVAIVKKRQLLGRGAGARFEDQMAVAPDVVVVDADIIGLSEVDPGPLSTMGEAIDPDAVTAAHEEIAQQRDKLPSR